MPRRIMSLWFPRFSAERVLRQDAGLAVLPFAVTDEVAQTVQLVSLTPSAEAAGLSRGMGLTDARAICPALVTRSADRLAEAAFQAGLRRWAGRFSPWVGEQTAAPGTAALVLDISGCAHLFGGEAGMVAEVTDAAESLGLSVLVGLADTLGAAWALARYAGQAPAQARNGDAIDQEAYATRSRAHKRRNWERGGPAPSHTPPGGGVVRIAAPGATLAAIGDLPVGALRLSPEAASGLVRLGLVRVRDLASMPRGALARRFGADVVRRLDQALGGEPEPVSANRPDRHFARSLTLPEPIGRLEDVEAGLARLLPPLCTALDRAGMGARRLRLELRRVDGSAQVIEIGLARPGRDPAQLRPLFDIKLAALDAGFGIDLLRLSVPVFEPLSARQHSGHLDAQAAARALVQPGGGEEMAALIGRIGARVGLDRITRLYPNQSHIPEKTATVVAAAYSEPASDWPAPARMRPLSLFAPEPIRIELPGRPPARFRWRRRDFDSVHVTGPERIAPEWWLDDPAWRSGVRDYWRVETGDGTRLWLFQALARGLTGPGARDWFVQGVFA